MPSLSLPAPFRFEHSLRLAGIALASLLVLPGCPSVGSFTIEEESDERKVEGSEVGNTLGQIGIEENPFTFDIDLEQELEKRNADGAKGVFLQDLRLTLDTESGNQGNFDFFDSIVLYANADNQERKEIARSEPVPEGKKEFAFDVDDDVNLKPYIEEGLNLEADVEGRQPESDRTFKALITLRVETL